jgi:uroporphyrinogen-III synthase
MNPGTNGPKGTSMTLPLTGRTVAVAEGRQLEELAQMLEKEGARVLRCPLIGIIDAPDEQPVRDWLDRLIAGHFDYVVLLTGEGVSRLLGVAERMGKRDAAIAALDRAQTVARGPKPGRALKEAGLTAKRVAATPTTEGVITALRAEPLTGKTVGVQLYGGPNAALTDAIAAAGATPAPVVPYVYAASADGDRVAELLATLGRGEVDAIVFTSSPQIDRLYEVAAKRGIAVDFSHTRVAAVGPIVADALRRRGAPVHICPEQGFVMKNLVKHLRQALAPSK